MKITDTKYPISKLLGYFTNIDFGNPVRIAAIKKKSPETVYSCKPLKVDCEFCKEKIGLLNNDIFVKQGDKTDKQILSDV